MGKSLIFLYLKEKLYNLDLDNVQSLLDVNRILDSLHLLFNEQLVIPLKSDKNGYLVVPSNICDVEINGKKIDNDTKISHNELIKITFDELQYAIRYIEQDKLSLSSNAYDFSSAVIYVNNDENQIVFSSNEKDSIAKIERNEERYSITAIDGQDVFVNSIKTANTVITNHDIIHINGVSFSIINNYIFLPSNIKVDGLTQITKFDSNDVILKKEKKEDFSKKLRVYRSRYTEKITIDAPPEKQKQKATPLLLTLGPSMTMMIGMLASFGITISNAMKSDGNNMPQVITGGAMAFSMLLGSVMWPTLLRNYNKKQEKIDTDYKNKRYREYLNEKRNQIETRKNRNVEIWNKDLCPSKEQLTDIIKKERYTLWERSDIDEDFLFIRLGVGKVKSDVEISIPQIEFSLYDNDLLNEARSLKDEYREIDNMPIGISLITKKVVGVFGIENKLYDMVRNVIINLTALHSPDDVKICLVCNELQKSEFSFVREIHHFLSPTRDMRYFATNQEETISLFDNFSEVLRARTEGEKDSKKLPYYVFIILENKYVKDLPIYKYLIDNENNLNIASIFVANLFSDIPNECNTIIVNNKTETEGQCGVYTKNENSNILLQFTADYVTKSEAMDLGVGLSRIKMKVEKKLLSVPNKVNFLSMFKVGNVDELPIKERWKNNESNKTLAAPLGVKAGFEIFSLDLHEKHHGPHGLVAGTTGSGKSEFLQSYILSSMINYSPNEVAFVLVDFKGGDMARPFLKAPHLAATISNLSGNTLYRAFVSLDAEIKRRQKVFNTSASKLNIDKLDINSYHKYYKEGKLKDALPHLIIIIDEFAQLKTQQPEFMQKLIDIAQVGRSLGIHLILATQKPSGVVDPQIWSNSKFKVSLKVSEKQDSKDMIGRPDAASIKDPGRAFVLVGYDEEFYEIQSAFSGADYIPQEKYIDEETVTVKLFDNTLNLLRDKKDIDTSSKTGKTQLEMTVQKIVDIGNELNIHTDTLWKEPLKEFIYLSELYKDYTLDVNTIEYDRDYEYKCTLGLLDILKSHTQEPYSISLSDGHVAIFGAGGIGKTTLLQTIAFDLTTKYSPSTLNIYGLDFGGRNMGILSHLPHTKDVAYSDDEEHYNGIIDDIKDIIEERKILFEKSNCTNFKNYLKGKNEKIPAILLLIDNYSAFTEADRDYAVEEMTKIAASGTSYGVFVVATGNNKNAIHYKVLEQIQNKIVFKMNNKDDYRDILGVHVPFDVENIKGRGYVVYYKEPIEFQAALPLESESESDRIEKEIAIFDALNEKFKNVSVNKNKVSINTNKVKTKMAPVTNKNASKSIPFLNPVNDDGNTLVFGYSIAKDGVLQGVSLDSDKRIFIEGDEIKDSIILKLDSINKCKMFRFAGDNETYNTDSKMSNVITLIKSEYDKKIKFINDCKASGIPNDEINSKMNNEEKYIILIENFKNFFDIIPDDSLKILTDILANDVNCNFHYITFGNINDLNAYRDQTIYKYLVRCNNVFISRGKVTDEKAFMLSETIINSNKEHRLKELGDGKGILFDGGDMSFVEVD